MRRPITSLLALAVAAAGCGAPPEPDAITVPPPAAPRLLELGWRESAGGKGDRLLFGVRRFAVGADGWAADVWMENRTSVEFAVGRAERGGVRFGLMLFETGSMSELVRRNRAGELPTVREARRFEPELPASLLPGARWSGRISAPGSLPSGLWVRLVFGSLTALADPPQGIPADLVWITDRTFRL